MIAPFPSCFSLINKSLTNKDIEIIGGIFRFEGSGSQKAGSGYSRKYFRSILKIVVSRQS
jgi:hypothetical protein